MIRPAFTNVVGTYPEKENEIMLSTKTLQYLGIKNPEVGMEIELDFYWNDIFNTSGTGMQNFYFLGILQSIKIKPPVLLWLLYQRNQWRRTGFNGSHVGF